MHPQTSKPRCYPCAALLAALVFAAPGLSVAAVISGPDIIAAPASVIDDPPGATNTNQQAFNERQSVLLASDLAVDGGTISAGTRVNSHMIFLNTRGTGRTRDLNVTWGFDGAILGVMSDSGGNLEAASNAILGAPGTFYPGSFATRGFESDDSYTINGNLLTVSMTVTEPGDWIRVVSAVPVPAAVWFLGSGLVALVGVARRRRNS